MLGRMRRHLLQGKEGNCKLGHYDSGGSWPFIREHKLLKSHLQFIESIHLSSLVPIAEHFYIYIYICKTLIYVQLLAAFWLRGDCNCSQ